MREKRIFRDKARVIVFSTLVFFIFFPSCSCGENSNSNSISQITTYETFIQQRYPPVTAGFGCSSCSVKSPYLTKQSTMPSVTQNNQIINDSGILPPERFASEKEEIPLYALKQFTPDEMEAWKEQYMKNSPAPVSILHYDASTELTGEHSLLPYLAYIPVEYDQKNCNNCWIWVGTGILAISLNEHTGIKDRISVQYPTSAYNNGGLYPFSGDDFVCVSGGSITDLTIFYQDNGLYGGKQIIIPWSNTNAAFQDSDGAALQHTVIPPNSISKNPYYQIRKISPMTISTLNNPQTNAIQNIKYQIDEGRGVSLSFWLPDTIAWNEFIGFWENKKETDVFQIDAFVKTPYNYQEGRGHAVLVTGYKKYPDGSGYWECVNSWGAPTNRPAGTFRINMDMDYNSRYQNNNWPVSMWETIDVQYSITPTPTITPVQPLQADFIVSPLTGMEPLEVWFKDCSTGNPDSWQWNYGDGTMGTGKSCNHIYENGGMYSVTLNVSRDTKTATITKNNLIKVTNPDSDVVSFPDGLHGFYPKPQDLDGDGLYEDIDGNGFLGFQDLTVFFDQIQWAEEHEPITAFDFDRNGFLGFQDIVSLFGIM